MWRRMLTTAVVSHVVQLKGDLVRTEEEDECNAKQDQDVGHVGDSGVIEELHLLFGCAHEKEARGV